MTLDLDHLEAVARAAEDDAPWEQFEEWEVVDATGRSLLEVDYDRNNAEFCQGHIAAYVATFNPALGLELLARIRELEETIKVLKEGSRDGG
jgi:hypothetical protein